jgi:hypothetical protein
VPGTNHPRRTTVLGVVTALIASGAAVLSAPALAEGTTVTLHPTQLSFSESRLHGHNVVLADGVHVYTDDNTSLAKAAGYFAVNQPLADVGEPTMSTAPDGSGTAPGIQMVTDFDGDGSADGILVGESANKAEDGTTPDWWVASSALAFVKAAAPSCDLGTCSGGSGSDWHGTLDAWRDAFPDAQVLQGGWSLGSGVLGDYTITSITYGDTSFHFSKNVSKTHAVHPGDVDLSQTRPGGHNTFTAEGIHVKTDVADSSGKAAGYFDIPGGVSLAAVGQSTLDWTPANQDSQRPGVQLVVDVDHDGTADAIFVGEAAFGDNWWASSINTQSKGGTAVKNRAPSCNTGGPCTPAGYRQYNGSLAAWSAAFPKAVVTQGGYSLGSNAIGDGVLSGITIGETNYSFDNVLATRLLHRPDFDLSDTRSKGHVEFEADDLHVFTDDSSSEAKAAGYFRLTEPVALSRPGTPELVWTGTLPQPGNQLRIDFTGDGSEENPTWGTLVGEPVYGDDYWLTVGSPQSVKDNAPSTTGGSGSQWHGTLAQWAQAFPDAHIVTGGFSLGSGIQGDGRISAIVVGGTKYTFASSPTAADKTVSTPAGVPVAVTLAATGDHPPFTVTHRPAEHGTITGSGTALSYRPATGFAGTDHFTYAVTDALGGTDTAAVTVNVAKAPTTLSASISPAHPSSADTVRLRVAVRSTGDTTNGAVTAVVSGHTFRGAVHSGSATLTLGRYSAGTRTAQITFAGTGSTLSTTGTVRFTVVRASSHLSVRVTPKTVTTKTRATVHVTVWAHGASTTGGRISISEGGRHLASATVVGDGRSLRLPKLAKGRHHLTVNFAGTPTATAATRHVTVKVQAD